MTPLHNACPLCDLSLTTHSARICAEVQADNASEAAQLDALYMASLDAHDARRHAQRERDAELGPLPSPQELANFYPWETRR